MSLLCCNRNTPGKEDGHVQSDRRGGADGGSGQGYRPNFDPSRLKGLIRGTLNAVIVLGTPHLSGLPGDVPQQRRRAADCWDTRNLRIAANIRQALGSRPGSRMLVIVGASHKGYLEAYLSQMHEVRLVSTDAVLR